MKLLSKVSLSLMVFLIASLKGSDDNCRRTFTSLSFPSGYGQTIALVDRLIEDTKDRNTLFVAIWGYPDSGKSFLITQLANHYKNRGFECSEGGGFPPNDSYFKDVKQLSDLRKEQGEIKKRIYFIHLTTPREGLSRSEFAGNDPDILVKKYFGVPVDVNIGIFNPKSHDEYTGIYDVLISNSEAGVK